MKTERYTPSTPIKHKANDNKCNSLPIEKQTNTPKLTKRQQKVYDLLLTGRKSVADITIATGYSDPRSYIRDLRDKGIPVLDEWVNKGDVRFKRYYLQRKREYKEF